MHEIENYLASFPQVNCSRLPNMFGMPADELSVTRGDHAHYSSLKPIRIASKSRHEAFKNRIMKRLAVVDISRGAKERICRFDANREQCHSPFISHKRRQRAPIGVYLLILT